MTLTAAEQTFISRMADEIVRNPGMSMDDAAKAIIARDRQIVDDMIMAKSQKGRTIREAMASQVYKAIRPN